MAGHKTSYILNFTSTEIIITGTS